MPTRLEMTPGLEWFYRSAYERQRAHHLRSSGAKPPWTDDPMLSVWRVPNVFRELDPRTAKLVRLADEARRSGMTPGGLIYNMWLYRSLDLDEPWDEVTGGGQFVPVPEDGGAALMAIVNDRKEIGAPVGTPSHPTPTVTAMAATAEAMGRLAEAVGETVSRAPSLEEAFETLLCLPGIGNFLGYNLGLDVTYGYTDGLDHPLGMYSIDEWAFPGPGVMGGAEVVYGEPVPSRRIQSVMRALRDQQDEAFESLGLDFASVSGGRRLRMDSVERWLAEYYKYHRIKNMGARGRHKLAAVAR